ncbi:hypothetical protein Bca4012_025213 [Brassica carinata]
MAVSPALVSGLRILSELPTAEDVVATMVLSKHWLPLWKSVPKLVFDDDGYEDIDTGRFSRFVDRCLILHKAPIETLHFELTQSSTVADIGIWIDMAVQRCVRDLSIDIDCASSTNPVVLPRSLYAEAVECFVTLVDSSSLPSFSTLKTLKLLFVKYPGEEFVKRLLSKCLVLEYWDVEQCPHDNVTIFTVKVPSLKSAYLCKSPDGYIDEEDGFVIDAPSLELLVVYNNSRGFCTIENDMPNIVKAKVVVTHCPSGILSAITSVKRLDLCIPYSKDVYPVGSVFHRLVRLTISTSEIEWFNLLMCVLRDSPSLKALKLENSAPVGMNRVQFLNVWYRVLKLLNGLTMKEPKKWKMFKEGEYLLENHGLQQET